MVLDFLQCHMTYLGTLKNYKSATRKTHQSICMWMIWQCVNQLWLLMHFYGFTGTLFCYFICLFHNCIHFNSLFRALNFFLIFFQRIVEDNDKTESLQDHLVRAYAQTLEPHHGWVTRQIIVVCWIRIFTRQTFRMNSWIWVMIELKSYVINKLR